MDIVLDIFIYRKMYFDNVSILGIISPHQDDSYLPTAEIKVQWKERSKEKDRLLVTKDTGRGHSIIT